MSHDVVGPSPALSTLLQLIDDYHAFNPGGVEVYPYPSSLDFSRQVSRGRPCVYRLRAGYQRTCGSGHGSQSSVRDRLTNVDHVGPSHEAREILACPAFKWTKQDLCAKVTDDVEVAVTPDGRADSLYAFPRHYPQSLCESDRGDDPGRGHGLDYEREPVFVQPASAVMSLADLFDKLSLAKIDSNLDSMSDGAVYYLQSQNSNLTTTPLSTLLSDVPRTVPFAAPVLGVPEAVNLWIGTDASVTSTHRDPYENLYLVIKGKKKFTLYAPVEEICLHAQHVPTAHWQLRHDDGAGSSPSFDLVLDTPPTPIAANGSNSHAVPTSLSVSADQDPRRIPWIPIDPLNLPAQAILDQKYPHYRHARPLTVTVEAGEMLYLPAGWFHHVTQECGWWDAEGTEAGPAPCIAVNYWFDIDYEGEKYVMREMVGRLVETARNAASSYQE